MNKKILNPKKQLGTSGLVRRFSPCFLRFQLIAYFTIRGKCLILYSAWGHLNHTPFLATTGFCLSVRLSVRLSICLPVYLSVGRSVCRSVCLFVWLSLHESHKAISVSTSTCICKISLKY